MPTITENRQIWSSRYPWPAGGDEWSVRWGGADAQWFGAIYPRIHAFLPAATILEIAPGYGRWTIYLKDHCKRLVLVDLNQNCIDRCRECFAAATHLEYHVNDGKSLAMIGDGSLDFVFSFDSLVHAEADVIQAYLTQLAFKLAPNGVGFIHHSNLGAHRVRQWVMQQMLPTRLRRKLVRRGLLTPDGLRATSMTATLFAAYAAQAGLCCVSQEVVNWQGSLFSDCFSVFTRPGSAWARQNRVYRNRAFTREAAHIRQLATLYSRASFRDAD
jgi:2-polyprenyl-3-methyl-5-hydroxy-6-metoxy-1,4-benzoquinol methylase